MLATLVKLKKFLGITITDDDDKLFEHLKVADKYFKSECKRNIEQTTYTEYYDGDGSSVLHTKNYPIISVTSIHDDLDRAYEASALISSSDYFLYEDEGQIQLDELQFQKGSKNIKIVYSAGYASIPFDVEMAVIRLAAADFLEAHGTVAVIEGNEFLYKPNLLRKEAAKTIQQYRKVA